MDVDGHVGFVDGDALVGQRIVGGDLRAQVIAAIAPTQFVGIDLDALQLGITDVDALQQPVMAAVQRVGAVAVILARVGISKP